MGCSSSDQLLLDVGTSVKRAELRRLSRRQLRARLAELGAAKTEAEGLFHGELVDVVLLWNSLWKLKCSMHEHDSDGQAEAVRALKNSGLPAHLLRKALLVVGVPWKDCCKLNGKEAEVLLNRRLVQLIVRKVATNMISGTTFSLLLACFQGWKFSKSIPEAVSGQACVLDGDTVFESLLEESRKRDEGIRLMEQGKCEEAVRLAEHQLVSQQEDTDALRLVGSQDEEDPAFWREADIEDIIPCTSMDTEAVERKLSPKAKASPLPTIVEQPKKQRKSRGSKVSGAPKTPITPQPRPHTPRSAQVEVHVGQDVASKQDRGERRDKFDALDSELSAWLVDGSDDAPVGLGKLRR